MGSYRVRQVTQGHTCHRRSHGVTELYEVICSHTGSGGQTRVTLGHGSDTGSVESQKDQVVSRVSNKIMGVKQGSDKPHRGVR